MADRNISELNAATSVNTDDMFVLQQGGVAKKLLGSTLLDFVTVEAVDGHGGIKNIAQVSSSGTSGNGRIATYRITYADLTTFDYQVKDGVKGDTGTFQQPTAHNLAPGSTATVTNIGTTTNAKFDFGIPVGKTPDFQIGSIETVGSYEEADVDFSYDAQYNPLFDFKIPCGKSGVYYGATQPDSSEGANLWIDTTSNAFVAEDWVFVMSDGTEVTKKVYVSND